MLDNYFSQYAQLISPKSYTNKSFSSNANLKSSQSKDDYFELFNREWKLNLNLKQENVKMKKTINEISKQTADVVFETGEKINSIEDNVNSMNLNIENAVNHMKDAKKANESTSGYTNIILYTVAGIVVLLIILSLIMPSN